MHRATTSSSVDGLRFLSTSRRLSRAHAHTCQDVSVSSRTRKLAPPAWDALAEALATFEWFKNRFESLVRRLFADAPAVLARLNFTDPKRRVADELIGALRLRESDYQDVVVDALIELAQFDPNFPHLARLDDGSDKVVAAQTALRQVISITARYSDLASAREQLRSELRTKRRHPKRSGHTTRRCVIFTTSSCLCMPHQVHNNEELTSNGS